MNYSDECIKIVFLGESGTGKTSMILHFVQGSFSPSVTSTVGAAFFNHTMQNVFEGQDAQLAIWDTAGQETMRGLAPMYYRGAAAAIIVFDVTSRDSFVQVSGWIEEVFDTVENIVVAVVGNKIDLDANRVVSMEEGMKLAQENGLIYCETSAKTGAGLDFLFQKVMKMLISNNKELVERIVKKNGNTQELVPNEEGKKKCCN